MIMYIYKKELKNLNYL